MALGLILPAVVALAGAVVFALVARRIARRPATGLAARAVRAYAAWWAALGAMLLVSAVLRVIAFLDVDEPALVHALVDVAALAFVVGLWGIATYVAYLSTGRDVAAPLGVAGALSLGLAFYLVNLAEPSGLTASQGFARLVFAAPFPSELVAIATLIALVPLSFATGALVGVARQLSERVPRRRAARVLGLVALWSAWTLLAIGAHLLASGALAAVLAGAGVLLEIAAPSLAAATYLPGKSL